MTIRLCCALVSLILAHACSAQAERLSPASKPANSKPAKAADASGTHAPNATSAVTPEERARALIERQLKALPEDHAALAATFARDAGVFLPNGSAEVHNPELDLASQLAFTHPHTELKRAKLTSLVAGGNASMVWLAADLEIVVASYEPGEQAATQRHAVRAVELLDAASDWKVVAASFTEVHALQQRRATHGPIPSATPPGPLVKLLTSPDALASALASDPVIVLGTDKGERAVGQSAAKALLGKWRKLPLELEQTSKVREVHTKAWGYAMAEVNIPKPGDYPFRMSAFVIAVPAPSGAWSVVAVSYGAR